MFYLWYTKYMFLQTILVSPIINQPPVAFFVQTMQINRVVAVLLRCVAIKDIIQNNLD